MIGYFPEAYPDELFYSICARFSDKMQYPARSAPTQELFGTAKARATVDLPSHLETVVKRLPPGHHYTVDRLIDYHTLFPFYRPFLQLSSQQRLRNCMHKYDGIAKRSLMGGNQNTLYTLSCLRFCLQCVEEDRKLFGECYWHRVHQLSCVRICPTHSVPLLESGIRSSNKTYEHEFISAEKAVQEKYTLLHVPEPFYNHSRQIAHDVSWLLDHPQFVYDSDVLKTQYYTVLFNQDLADYGKRIYTEKFLQRFNDYYTQDFLRWIDCELEGRAHTNWVRRTVRPRGSGTHPLHHLLLIHFLGYEAEPFFSLSTKQHPFGDGPWPCLNPASDHYKQDRVLDCQCYRSERSKRGKPTGLFSCECGFVYLRKGPDMTPNDRFRLSQVKTYGPVWEATLQQLWDDPTITINEIARRLRVDQRTAVHKASRMGLSSPRPGSKREWKLEDRRAKRGTPIRQHSQEEYRQAWLLLMEKNPEAGRSALQRRLPGVYTWLSRNDPEWLKAHLPIASRWVPPRRQIDWESRDKVIAEAVKASAHRLKNTDGYPTQLTLTALGRDTGHLIALSQQLDKLPLTRLTLSTLVETDEDFAIRRVSWSASRYREENICPTPRQLARRVYVRGKMAEWPRVKEAIDVAWASLSSIRDGDHG